MNKRKGPRRNNIFIVFIFIAILSTVLILGTREKSVNEEDFINVIENNGYVVKDITETLGNRENVEKCITNSEGNGNILLYLMKDGKSAKSTYNYYKETIEGFKECAENETEIIKRNRYILDSEVYYVVMRVKNAVLFIEKDTAEKENINKIINSIKS